MWFGCEIELCTLVVGLMVWSFKLIVENYFYLAHLWTDFQPCLLYLGQKVFIKSLIMMIVKYHNHHSWLESCIVETQICFQDADGFITPLEMHIVTRLFLPMETEADDNFVEELIEKMDTNVDGKIDYQEFVHFVRNCGTADILSTQTSRSSENNSP